MDFWYNFFWLKIREAVKFLWKGSTLKKEAGSGSKLGSIWLFEVPEADAFFIKHGVGMWKWKLWKELNFCGSRSKLGSWLTTYRAGSGSKKYSTASTLLLKMYLVFFFQSPLMSVRVAGEQQLNIEPPHITVHHHLQHFAWLKPEVVPFKILNVVCPSCSWLSYRPFPFYFRK